MSDIYIVIENSDNAAPDVCEVYSDKQQALGRASALAHFAAVHHSSWDISPKEKVDVQGNQYWVFLNNSGFNRHYVAVYYKKVEDKVTSKSFTIPTSPLPPPKDDPMDPTLPAGWTYNGKPITMADLLEDPYNIKPTYDLSESQRYALVTSRIKKRPQFFLSIPSIFRGDQKAVLHELETKTNIGHEIVMLECVFLDRILSEQKDAEAEESSSESSSEDY